jgi:MSHA biogenesis protein MshN
MSLINQVLQDLEKRHASDPEIRSLPPHVRAVPTRSWLAGREGIALILVGAAAAGAVWWIMGSSSNRQASPEARTLPPPKPIAVTGLPSKPAAATPPPTPAAPPVALPVTPVVEPVVQAALFKPVSRLSAELAEAPAAPKAAKKAADKRATKGQENNQQTVSKANGGAKVPVTVVPGVASGESAAAVQPAPVAAPASDSAPAAGPAASDALPTSPASAPTINKQMRELPPAQRAEVAFRRGVTQLQEGRASLAEENFRDALNEDPNHASARQALLGLMLDGGRNGEAEQLLRGALEVNPRQPRHAMVLARLEVERGDTAAAVNTLVAALPYVQQDPEYYAFLAAMLQRDGRHRESAEYYRAALRLIPGNSVWMMGLGISLRGGNQLAEAREAFQRAADSRSLGPELQQFVERQLKELAVKKK